MRTYFVSAGFKGSYAVRCLLPLMENGWDGDITSMNGVVRTPESMSEAAQHADVVVFHRPQDEYKLEIARIMRQNGKKIVYDNDDTIKEHAGFMKNEVVTEQKMDEVLEGLNKMNDEFITGADMVTCSTEFLAEEYRKLNDNVVVLPNCVDPFYFDDIYKNESDKIRIGIVGSIGLTDDLLVAEPIIRALMGRKDVTVVFFSLPRKTEANLKLYDGEYKFLDTVDVEWHPFVDHENYYDYLNELRLDISIIPRADNYFNRCKSNLKFLEASMLEIPTIAQGFDDGQSPYQVDPQDADHMVIVNDNDKWMEEIEKLIDNKDLRREMGAKAREYVEDKYSIEKNAHLWEEAYKTLFKKHD